ncbi:uncharacterized protein UTRI_03416_B [Ustilago trichophora]|uniref:Macrophage erythroblast attacher n=1 Tax=Ustilago trichophora TaxID=86804 RepID=A0A5C3E1X1_9BASI|nr:uncharacterized protein UTRI_03416_B [Ustilago trichophora]
MMESMAVDAPPPTETLAVSSSNAPNLDGILLLEAPFARVPFDELRRQQKTQQRLVERELLFASTSFADATKSLSSPSTSSGAAEVEKSLDAVLGRLKGLKRKLAPLSDAAKSSLRMAQSRTDHLAALHTIQDVDSAEFSEWSKTRLDRMIVDYMLRRGYRSAAQELAQSRGILDLVDLQLFEEVARVEDSLCPPGWNKAADGDGEGVTKPSCTLALAWCSENKATLRKIRTPLEFNLRLQEFVELTRTRTADSIKEAIAYARRHLLPLVTAAPTSGSATSKPSTTTAASTTATTTDKESEYDRLAAEAIRREVSRAMGLLACGPHSWPYADLYSLNRWSMLRDSFRACALQIHSLPPQPILHIALSAGLSSLKLPQCYSSSSPHPTLHDRVGGGGPNVDCPICDAEGLGKLAKEVPWSHHQNSTLVCSHSGRIMDENDPPLALGNGRVYAQSSVLELVSGLGKDEGITCPRTAEVCRVEDTRKVYIS